MKNRNNEEVQCYMKFKYWNRKQVWKNFYKLSPKNVFVVHIFLLTRKQIWAIYLYMIRIYMHTCLNNTNNVWWYIQLYFQVFFVYKKARRMVTWTSLVGYIYQSPSMNDLPMTTFIWNGNLIHYIVNHNHVKNRCENNITFSR